MINWYVQSLRLTIFPYGSQIVDPAQWWLEVVGENPDNIQARPKQNQVVMQSNYELGTLTFELHPDRINWLYSVPVTSEEDDLILSLGFYDAAIAKFSEITDKWFRLNSCPAASRIALGIILDIPVTSKQEGYRMLSSFLPSVKLDENSSDFLYQINRPRLLRLSDLEVKINRLSKWSVTLFVQNGIIISPTSVQALSPTIQNLSCRLELDISTSQDYSGVLDSKEQSLVFSQLILQSGEIAERGDIQ